MRSGGSVLLVTRLQVSRWKKNSIELLSEYYDSFKEAPATITYDLTLQLHNYHDLARVNLQQAHDAFHTASNNRIRREINEGYIPLQQIQYGLQPEDIIAALEKYPMTRIHNAPKNDGLCYPTVNPGRLPRDTEGLSASMSNLNVGAMASLPRSRIQFPTQQGMPIVQISPPPNSVLGSESYYSQVHLGNNYVSDYDVDLPEPTKAEATWAKSLARWYE